MSQFVGIAVVDVDAKIPLAERIAYAAAQTEQLVHHFAPRWHTEGLPVRAATPDALPKSNEIQLHLLDKPTMDGALGYHDMLDDGTPVAYVFAGLAAMYGDVWTSIASHEALELSADPFLRRCVQMHDGFWDMEICDRVEQDSYFCQGVTLSNFNTPECFEPPNTLQGVTFDYLGLSTVPNQVRSGGYAQRFDPSKGWQTVGKMSAYRAHLAALGMGRVQRRQSITPRPSFLNRLFGR